MSRWGPGLAVGMAIWCALVLWTSNYDNSPAFDEPEHACAGYSYVMTGQFWMNPFHPPLVKYLSGLAMAAGGFACPWRNWQAHKKMPAIDDFFGALGNDPQRIIRYARTPLIVLGALFLLPYYFLVARQLGRGAGALAVVLLGLSPTYLAHAALVDTDAAAAWAAFFCVAAVVEQLSRPGRLRLAGLAVVTGVAQLVKFSLPIVYPFYLLAYLLWRRNPLRDGLVVAGVSLLIVVGAYSLLPTPPEYQSWYTHIIFKTRNDPIVNTLKAAQSWPGLRPAAWYVTGLYAQTRHLLEGHDRPAYLKKTYYQGGRWDFFPVLILSKEPVGFLILAALAGLGAVWGRRSRGRVAALYAGFVVLYLSVALGGKLNLGIRHALPVYPAALACIGWGVGQLLEALRGRRRVAALSLMMVAVLWSAVSVGLAWPGYLAYFNELVGGKRNGPEVALDSNFDWGVDLYRLKLWAEAHGNPPLRVLYYGRLDPTWVLGPQVRRLADQRTYTGELLAVSANYYVQARLHLAGRAAPPAGLSRTTLQWLCSREVEERVGDSILILRSR